MRRSLTGLVVAAVATVVAVPAWALFSVLSSNATGTSSPPGNSGGARTIDATGTTAGVATAAARLTVDPS